MKILYEHPTQILPILSLVSNERGTGKTTFLNWQSILILHQPNKNQGVGGWMGKCKSCFKDLLQQ